MAEEKKPQKEYIQVYQGLANPPALPEVSKMQVELMKRLFPETKNPYSLAEWHYKREDKSDLHLYAAMGFFSTVEYEFYRHRLDRWQDEIFCRRMNSDDYEEGAVRETIQDRLDSVPKLSNLLKTWNFDRNENLMLELETPLKIISNLDYCLYVEGVRLNKKESVSAVDELLCQGVDPINEAAAWCWMNRMVAGNPRPPMKMALDNTAKALRDLNVFQIYRCLADVCMYSQAPIASQRIKGKLETCLFPGRAVRMQTALGWLEDEKKLIDHGLLDAMLEKKPAERAEYALILKRRAVSAFLTDLARAAPTDEWLKRMIRSFERYFQPILQQVGQPVLEMRWHNIETSKGVKGQARVAHICFIDKGKKIAAKPKESLSANSSKER